MNIIGNFGEKLFLLYFSVSLMQLFAFKASSFARKLSKNFMLIFVLGCSCKL